MSDQHMRPSSSKDPLHNAFELYFHGTKAANDMVGPMPRAAAIWQTEMLSFGASLSRNYLNFFQGISKTPTPEGIAERQAELFTAVAETVAQSSGKMIEAFTNTGLVLEPATPRDAEASKYQVSEEDSKEPTSPTTEIKTTPVVEIQTVEPPRVAARARFQDDDERELALIFDNQWSMKERDWASENAYAAGAY